VAKIVFHDWESCCIRREIDVEKHYANFQVVAHSLRGCHLCKFYFRPRGRHSGSGRRARGFGKKDERIGYATNPGTTCCGYFSRCREGATKQAHNQNCPREGNNSGNHGNDSSDQGNNSGNQDNNSSSHGNNSGSQDNNSGGHGNGSGTQGNNSAGHGDDSGTQDNNSGGHGNDSGNHGNNARANPDARCARCA